ncbi:MAG: ATP synthase F0 subunit B [bacterium]
MELLRSIFAQIGINNTFYLQFILVVVVYFFMSKMLFKPILAIFVSRRESTLGLRRKAEEALMDEDKINEAFLLKWNEYETEAKNIRDLITEKAQKEAKSIMRDASKKADIIINDKKTEISQSFNEVKQQLNKELGPISDSIKNKLIGRG